MKRPRPRLKLKRPSLKLRRPRLRRRGSKRAAAGAKSKPAKGPANDLWFRASTRVRALGYGIREKAQKGLRLLRAADEWVADLWLKRSRAGKIRIGAVAGVLVLYAVVKFIPIPGVPCQISAAKECAPPDEAVALVPADALLYAHVTLDEETAQFERAEDAFEQLADLRTILAAEIPSALPTPSGAQIDIQRDILPWAERDLSAALLDGPKKTSIPVFIAGVGDREGADQFLVTIAPSGEPKSQQQGDAALSVYPGGFAAAYVEEGLVFGQEAGVRAALDAGAGTVPAIEDSPQNASRDELPESRFAEIYLSREGVQRLLVGRTGAAAQLETFVDYGATSGLAAALVAREEGLEINLVSELDPKLAEESPSFFSGLPDFEPALADEAGGRAISYIGVGDLGPTLTELLNRGGGGAQGLVASLQALAARLEQEAGVNPLRDLLPTLKGQAALVAEPTDGVPFASLIVEGVDEGPASEALAGLQKPVLGALAAGRGAQVPRFEESEEDGVTVRSVQVAPTVNLSYALFDGKLVVSTDPAGIAQVRADAARLADSGVYERSTDQLPDQVSALVFLNLDELFGQVTRTDLVEDPFFANLSVLFENASSLGLAVNGEDDRIRSELFLTLD